MNVPKLKKGFVHIYTGEGKGKTTAALGLGLRAAGCNRKVCVFQFFKDKKFPCGEADAIKQLKRNFRFKRFNITHPMFRKTDIKDFKLRLKKAVNEADRELKSENFDVIILDEILVGVSQGFVGEEVILKIIKSKPEATELILTGRGATRKLIASADYVTYMRDVKHPFAKGVNARKGIEF